MNEANPPVATSVSQPATPSVQNDDGITLSSFTIALLHNLSQIKKKAKIDEHAKILVSKTVSFFAIAYEKVRNAVEYREEHFIRHAAIERILKRRLLLNPEGKGEAENLIRELLWARYFPDGSLGTLDVEKIQKVLNIYIQIKKKLTVGQTSEKKAYYATFLFDLLTCEIEEALDPYEAKRSSLFISYVYQVLKDKVKIEKVSDELKDAYFYVAAEKAYAKSNDSYLRYHLFQLSHGALYEETQLVTVTDLPTIFTNIDHIIHSPHVDKLTRYIRKQLPPFLVLFSLIQSTTKHVQGILENKSILWSQVDQICREKYQFTRARLRNLAIRSFVYIFLTKMIFAIILEFPLSKMLFNEVNYVSIGINAIFPALLMIFIVFMVRVPGEDNTKRIFDRIIDVINKDDTYEKGLVFTLKPAKEKRPVLVFGFTIFYTLTFMITLFVIHQILLLLHFNLVSEVVFIFFVSVVSFFGYRISQVAKEYHLQEKEGVFSPFVDFFFMPILSLGKWFSSGISHLNVFIVILDFLIEAPFKLIFEVIEEWISFVGQRKEEIM